MEHDTIPERMREAEIFGVPALFTDRLLSPESAYPGLYRYELQAGESGKPLGTVLTPVPLPVDDSIDTGNVELRYADGSMISIDCTEVKYEFAHTVSQQ